MNRRLLIFNAALAAALLALWALESMREAGRESARRRDSTLVLLSGAAGTTLEQVARLELKIKDSAATWIYARQPDGWHAPQYRNAFALAQNLDGLIKTLLESRGTPAGSLPAGAEHFGLTPGETLKVDLLDAGGTRRMRALVGRVAPGERSTECWAAADGSADVLQYHANPWTYLQPSPHERFPPLLDYRVVALALGRRSISKIVLEGRQPAQFAELRRKDVEEMPRPRTEWYGVPPGGIEVRLKDAPAFSYVNGLAGLTFDDLLGARADLPPGTGGFDAADRVVTLFYDGQGAEGPVKDTLILGAPHGEGLHFLLNASTGQVFLISMDKVKALTPDDQAMLPGPEDAQPPAETPKK